MQLLYMDESGVEELLPSNTHFVLLGLMIPADLWKSITEQLEVVKDRYALRDVEIHTGWMYRGYSEQDSVPGFESLDLDDRRTEVEKAIRRRAGIIGVTGRREKVIAYRRESKSIRPYIHLTQKQRRDCLLELANKLVSFSGVRIFADAISKADFVPHPGILESPYEMAFEQVLTRSQTYLGVQRDLGIMISDNNSKAAPRLTTLSRKYHRTGTFYSRIPNIVETPLFVDSSLTRHDPDCRPLRLWAETIHRESRDITLGRCRAFRRYEKRDLRGCASLHWKAKL